MSASNEILKTVLDNISFTSDPSKIIITIDDLKYIPQLSEIISFEKIVQNKTLSLNEFNDLEKEKIIFKFLKKYVFIQKFNKKWYFDYTKLYNFWPDLEYYKQIFKTDPDLKFTTNDEEHSFYLWENIKLHDKIYIGYMFFSGYDKIKNEESINEKEYTYFTDINFGLDNLGIIDNFEVFFLKQFSVFINTNHGSVFGDSSFGSNLKNYIQSKNRLETIDKIQSDIKGFVNDISILYNNAIQILNIKVTEIDEYSYVFNILLQLNEKKIEFTIKKS